LFFLSLVFSFLIQAVASKLHGVDVDIKIIKRKGEPLDPVEKLNEKINILTTTSTSTTATTLDNQNNLQQQQEENVAQSPSGNYTTIDNIHEEDGVNDGNDANRGDNDDDDEVEDDTDNDKENCGEPGNDNLCQYQTDLKIIKQCKNCLCIKMTSATSTSTSLTTSNGSTNNNANNVKCKL
jgi:hypothetical protein